MPSKEEENPELLNAGESIYGQLLYYLQNLNLRFPQILEDQLHLSPGEVTVIDTVARSKQRGQEAVSMVDVAVEAAQGVRSGADGEVHRGEFAFGIRFNHICLEFSV